MLDNSKQLGERKLLPYDLASRLQWGCKELDTTKGLKQTKPGYKHVNYKQNSVAHVLSTQPLGKQTQDRSHTLSFKLHKVLCSLLQSFAANSFLCF